MKTSRSWRRTLLFGFIPALAIALPADASGLTVNSTADNGTGTCTVSKCTLRDAILSAVSGDEITFSLPANSTIVLTNGALSIDKDLVIKGPGPSSLTVTRSTAPGTADFRILDLLSAGTADISGLTITNGIVHSSDGGGAIHNAGRLALTNCIISGNVGTQIAGGIANTGVLVIVGSTIAGNSAAVGGAIHNSGFVSITNSTISGNAGGLGGGIYNASAIAVTITNSTISGNTSPGTNGGGGGIANTMGGTLKLRSTIVAKNTAIIGPDIYSGGTVTSQGYNLIGNNSGATITATTGDQIGIPAAPIDPLLGPLQDNGGSTKTQALLSGSKAIDKGDSGGSSTDQRGFTRPVDTPLITNAGDGSDIGAYEVQTDQLVGCSEINLVVNSKSDSGAGSLRSVIASACGGSTITFASNVLGVINLTSGELLLDKNLTINGPGANLLTVQRVGTSNPPFFRIFDISKADSRIAISGLAMAGGRPAGPGGGVYNLGTLALAGVAVSGNFANNGGGIFNNGGAMEVANSIISGNSVSGLISGSGGGIFSNGGTLYVVNSTISGNTAIAGNSAHDDSGGGIITNVGTVTLINTTIAANSADFGGGMRNINGGTVRARNTIIARNTSPHGPDFNGPLGSLGFMLIGNNDMTMMAQTGYDQIGTPASMVNPLLGPLKNNGGPTATQALQPGSPAIDKGGDNNTGTDQRGFVRPLDEPNITNPIPGDGSDIGAFEFGSSLPTPTPTPTPTPAAQLSNISTRVRVLTGDKVLIGGFIVTGSAAKKVIIRAIGPSLTSFGIAGALADPILELHKPGNIVITNDNWKTTQQAAIQATGIAPRNDLESAIVATLVPGNYTAIVRGKNNGIGVGLVEAYDLDQAAASQLGNISTRGFVDTGENVMIGGIIVGPTGAPSGKMLIRAIGPSLASSGIAGPLADPTLELHNGNGVLTAFNDNWKTSQQAVIQATGIPPTNDKESAILATLAPGNYTAIVRGKNNITGVALVEVYSLK